MDFRYYECFFPVCSLQVMEILNNFKTIAEGPPNN